VAVAAMLTGRLSNPPLSYNVLAQLFGASLDLATTIHNLIATGVAAIKLDILVFGPQVTTMSSDARTLSLQKKRIQIRDELISRGHNAKYAEELVDPTLTGPDSNAVFQELLIMSSYDLVVNVVDSPGSIVEATMVALRPDIAQKTALFLDGNYVGGLVHSTCMQAKEMGAHYQTYSYPNDLDECHLLGFVLDRVRITQKKKYLS
jgi:hypothetical protein